MSKLLLVGTLRGQILINIKLTRGYYAIIDDCDYKQLNYKWSADVAKNDRIYATRIYNGKHLRLHVAIMQPPVGYEVDHIDRNGLNNTRRLSSIGTDTEGFFYHDHS